MNTQKPTVRHLLIILGDQLNLDASVFDDIDTAQDVTFMAEVQAESTHIPSSKQRSILFLSAMRHFAAALEAKRIPLHYVTLDDPENTGTLGGELQRHLQQYIQSARPQKIIITAPGDWRVLRELRAAAKEAGLPIEVRDDRHFLTTVRDFSGHAKSRKQLRLEYFYRDIRKRTGILMDGAEPIGGKWNYDADNRGTFPASGPENIPPPMRFVPDAITQEVIALVNGQFASHPGTVDDFYWPVTREQALATLEAFIQHRLPLFGRYQDAMWQGEVWLYHAHISSSLNLKLLNPREVATAAEHAYRSGAAPLNAVEGFIRQVIGWREYVRGIYWTQMPEYQSHNALNATQPLPVFYWTGDTDMACLRDAITQTLKHGYAHHIQRLMVTGLYALLLGVKPQEVHEWYLGMYVDAVEWVELPNTLGMSQFADGGIMASKPYAATGKYIQRMSNYCKGCKFDPAQSVGSKACPFTTLYWDFLSRHEALLSKNPRMGLQFKNLQRLSIEQLIAIKQQASTLKVNQAK